MIDLNQVVNVNSYEHPATMKERAYLRNLGEVFPYSPSTSRRVDGDHCERSPEGPTSDRNLGPLRRSTHRAKTHLGYTSTQVSLTQYIWRSPHGLYHLIDHTGTHRITEQQARQFTHPDPDP